MKRPRRHTTTTTPGTVLDVLVRSKSGPEFRAYWVANKAAILKAHGLEKRNFNQ